MEGLRRSNVKEWPMDGGLDDKLINNLGLAKPQQARETSQGLGSPLGEWYSARLITKPKEHSQLRALSLDRHSSLGASAVSRACNFAKLDLETLSS